MPGASFDRASFRPATPAQPYAGRNAGTRTGEERKTDGVVGTRAALRERYRRKPPNRRVTRPRCHNAPTAKHPTAAARMTSNQINQAGVRVRF